MGCGRCRSCTICFINTSPTCNCKTMSCRSLKNTKSGALSPKNLSTDNVCKCSVEAYGKAAIGIDDKKRLVRPGRGFLPIFATSFFFIMGGGRGFVITGGEFPFAMEFAHHMHDPTCGLACLIRPKTIKTGSPLKVNLAFYQIKP